MLIDFLTQLVGKMRKLTWKASCNSICHVAYRVRTQTIVAVPTSL